MRRTLTVGFAVIAAALAGHLAQAQAPQMGFFITSAGPGKGADLGGLAGADAHCQKLAAAAGAGARTWHAYLSTTAAGNQPAVNARDRLGAGPWTNAKGVTVATSVADLHSPNNKLSKENSLTETGAVVNGRGDTPNRHDILTGSTFEGNASTEAGDTTCRNWTSTAGQAMLGHSDRQGGSGLFYCFAID